MCRETPFHSRELITDALDQLLAAAVEAGQIRADVEVEDIFMGLAGVSMVGDHTEPDQSARLLDLLMDGLRYRR